MNLCELFNVTNGVRQGGVAVRTCLLYI